MKREFDILMSIIQANRPISAEDLAEEFEVSARTIRDDIKKLETYLENTSISLIRSKKGFTIDSKQADKDYLTKIIDKMKNESDFYSAEDRFNIVLQILLSEEYFSIQRISEEIKVARSATIRTLNECEDWLKQKNITINKPAGKKMIIQANETDYRKACVSYISTFFDAADFQKLYEDVRKEDSILFNLWANDFVRQFTQDVDLIAVKNFIKKYEHEQNLRLTDESFLTTFVAICISITRFNDGHHLDESKYINILVNFPHITEWIYEYKKYFKENFGLELPTSEMKCILVWLLVANKRYTSNAITDNFNERFLVKHFINIVEGELKVNLVNDETLFNNLLMHISPTIHRMLYDITIENPLKKQIKEQYPKVYDACRIGCNFIYEQLGIMPNDDEVGYLTMHVAVALEKNNSARKSMQFYKVIIVCSSGVATSNMLATKIINRFPNVIVERITSINEYKSALNQGIDFIVSTIPIPNENNYTVFCVSPLLPEEEAEKIKKYMNITSCGLGTNSLMDDISNIAKDIFGEKNIGKFKKELSNYFIKNQKKEDGPFLSDFANENTIAINQACQNTVELVRLGGNILVKSGDVKKEYINVLLDAKEKMGPAIVIQDRVALSHARYGEEINKLGFSFITLNKAVDFGNDKYKNVELLITLAATKEKKHLNALREIVQITTSENTVNKLINAKTANEFRNILIDFENNKLLK